MRKFFVFVIIFCCSIATSAQYKINKKLWKVVFEDEFRDSTSIVLNNWHSSYTWGKQMQPIDSIYFNTYTTTTNILTKDDLLFLYTHKIDEPIQAANNFRYYYTNAVLRSKGEDFPNINPTGDTIPGGYLYGMFEISCRLPKAYGQFPAFWLCGNNSWPPEIDIFEYHNGKEGQRVSTSVHWNNPDYLSLSDSLKKSTKIAHNLVQQDDYYKFYDYTAQFHTFNLVWTPTRISWFYDGQELKTDTIAEHIHGYLDSIGILNTTNNLYELCKWNKMDVLINSGLNYPKMGDTTINKDLFLIDYIKIYKPAALEEYIEGDLPTYFREKLVPAYQYINQTERRKKKPNKVLKALNMD